MTTPDAIARQLLANRAAARPIANADWQAGGTVPADQDAGYAAQAAMTTLLAEQGQSTIGYKIGATNQMARDLLGVETPFFGRLYDATSSDGPGELSMIAGIHEVAEPEIAIRLGHDLDPSQAPFDAAAIEAATDALLPAIEVIISCFEPWMQAGAPSLIADNGAHGSWIMGTAVTDWSGFDPLDSPVQVSVTGADLMTGRGGAVDGGAFGAAAWLANKLASQGRGLKAGEYISTGTVTPPIKLAPGMRIDADYGALGRISLAVS